MYPDLKFMNSSNDDIAFAPLENIEINNGFFIPEEFIEEFRTSSISTNPLKFDFRETLINANIENKEEELKDLIALYESDPEVLRGDLKSYNDAPSEFSFENLITTPLSSDILRELDLDVDEEVLELNKDFEEGYALESRYPNKCNPNIIFNNILNSNPRIMNIFQAYRVPFPVSKQIIMQVINATIRQCSNNNPNNSNNWFPKPGQNIPNFYGAKEMGDLNDV
ncbi:MAG: hypothetical protein ACRC28_19175 [Clostridium sp.]|uniref:hypothetical protein n=1 Tax=Clostridium sp. TaxID=1506 RepID=UPI003F3EAE80